MVAPAAIAAPSLVVAGRRDTIAPPPLADPLALAIPGARRLAPQTGHVGMIVGSLARQQVWGPIAGFLADPGSIPARDPARPSG